MAQKPRPDALTIRPLWVIANLLLLIAVCLLLVVIKNQFFDSPQEASTPESASENPPPTNANRAAGNTLRITSRQSVNSRRAAIATHLIEVGESIEATPESGLVPPDPIPPPAPAGVSAAVIAAATNISTAIAGRVTLHGDAPPEKPIDMSGSPCAKLPTNSPTTRFFVVSPDGGLADVLVSIVGGLDRKRYEVAQTNHELAFVNCQIQPYVSAVIAGQRVLFRNADHITHNVHLTATNNPEVNVALTARSASSPFRLRSPEDFLRVKCDVHPWEFAYVSVVEHPFFAITDTNGNFVIPNLPAGKYTLRALHRKAQGTNATSREVRVIHGEITQVNFTLDAPAK